MEKTYILDTNVLITSPYSIMAFDEHNVSIADITLEELDKLKTATGERGANAREAIRLLDKMRETGNLADGVPIPMGGTFKIEVNHKAAVLPDTWDEHRPDNRILRVCKGIKDTGHNAILVSNDINMRIKADIIGVPAEEYKTEQMQRIDKQYKGRREIVVDSNVIDAFYSKKWAEIDTDDAFVFNEFVLLKDVTNESHSAIGRFDGQKIVPLQYVSQRPYGVQARNLGQRYIQEALYADVEHAPLVIAKGSAGTSKTFYSLAVGLQKVVEEQAYKRILVTRPNIKFDEDIGFLKGTEEEKIAPLIRPVMDNLEVLTEIKGANKDDTIGDYSNYLFDSGYIAAQAMAYMRGRSVANTWIIVDEAQNMTPLQAFGIISRTGVGSKVILIGDPEQIDRPYLDSRTNGLTYASEKMKGSALCWQLTFSEDECVRSPIALEAIKRMTPKGELKKQR